MEHVNFQFLCYQTAYKLPLESIFGDKNPIIVIMDEIHDMLTPVYFNFAKDNLIDTDIARMGLSATIDSKTKYDLEGKEINKKYLLDLFCPVVYSYTINQGQEDKTSREVNLFILEHNLDKKEKTIETGSKTTRWLATEFNQYSYYDKEFKKSLFLPHNNKSREFLIRAAASRRAKLLYDLPSKIESCKELLKILAGRTLVFGNSINSLKQITKNCISSHNKPETNNEILNKFQTGKIHVIASFKMLEQGANLKELNNIVLHSYYGREKAFIQRLGRGRKDINKPVNLIVFVTKETQEEVWFKNMIADFNITPIWCNHENFKEKYYERN